MRKSLIVCLAVGVLTTVSAAAQEERPPFPEIALTTPSGDSVSLRRFLGTATVLNFWATWCGPCRAELPELARLRDEVADKGVVVLPVNIEGGRADVATFLGALGVAFDAVSIPPRVAGALGIDTVPFTVLLDRSGNVIKVYPGYSEDGMRDLRRLVLEVAGPDADQGG